MRKYIWFLCYFVHLRDCRWHSFGSHWSMTASTASVVNQYAQDSTVFAEHLLDHLSDLWPHYRVQTPVITAVAILFYDSSSPFRCTVPGWESHRAEFMAGHFQMTLRVVNCRFSARYRHSHLKLGFRRKRDGQDWCTNRTRDGGGLPIPTHRCWRRAHFRGWGFCKRLFVPLAFCHTMTGHWVGIQTGDTIHSDVQGFGQVLTTGFKNRCKGRGWYCVNKFVFLPADFSF